MRIKGSIKFWSIIGIVVLLFMNYRLICEIMYTRSINSSSTNYERLDFGWVLFIFIESLVLIRFSGYVLLNTDNGLIWKLNKYLDEKF